MQTKIKELPSIFQPQSISLSDSNSGIVTNMNFISLIEENCNFLTYKKNNVRKNSNFKEDFQWMILALESQKKFHRENIELNILEEQINKLKTCEENAPSRSIGENTFLKILLNQTDKTLSPEQLLAQIKEFDQTVPMDLQDLENRSFLAYSWISLTRRLHPSNNPTTNQKDLSYVYSFLKKMAKESEKEDFMVRNNFTGMLFCWDLLPQSLLAKEIKWDESSQQGIIQLKKKLIYTLKNNPHYFKYLTNLLPCIQALKETSDTNENFFNSEALELAITKFIIETYVGPIRKNCDFPNWFLHTFPLKIHKESRYSCTKNSFSLRDNAWMYYLLNDFPDKKLKVNTSILDAIGLNLKQTESKKQITPDTTYKKKISTRMEKEPKVTYINFIELMKQGKDPAALP